MVNVDKARSASKLLWGSTYDLPWYVRAGGLVFAIVAIASMSFTQLGFLSLGKINGSPLYLILLLAPVVMSALEFGIVTGTLLGLFGGIVAFVHASFLPLDFLEAGYFGYPINTIVLFAFIAFVAGLLFDHALKHNPQGGRRVAIIVGVSVFISFLASALVFVNMVLIIGGFELLRLAEWYLGISVMNATLQAIADAVLISVLCLGCDLLARKLRERGTDRELYSVFRNCLTLVAAIVFMVTSAAIFSNSTVQLRDNAFIDMASEADFMQKQLSLQPNIDAQLFLDDYDVELDGVAFTMDKQGVITASNDEEKFVVGSTLFKAIGLVELSGDEVATEALLEYYSSGRDQVTVIQDTDDDLMPTVDLAFLSIRKCEEGFCAIHRTASTIFANRFNTMANMTAFAMLLVSAIGILASLLVRRLIVRRINEANGSLARITEGHLDERVPKQSTREFTSLADGINTTVVALGDMIDEVAKRNEQDMATAKTIQESSLPTDFPAFPDIDTFDIYASMKTAKEVGGDFYDFFAIENTTRIGFVMADVSGKGIPAALFMMSARSQLRNFMETGMPLDEAVNAANHHLCIGNDAGMFVTCWVAELDYETGELFYVNGGHNPPMLLHDGAWTWLKEVSGMPLGLFDGIPYGLHTLQLVPGDMIYTYTDGVTEAMNVAAELYGEDRLEAVLDESKEMNPHSVGVAVRRSLADYTLGAEQSDDITMLILKYGVAPETGASMTLPADEAGLMHVRNFINAELDRRKAPKRVYDEFDALAAELFVNACQHAYPDATPGNPGIVRIGYEYQSNASALKVTIADDGVLRDPLANINIALPTDSDDSPGNDADVPEGTHKVDEATYEYVGGSNIVSFSKSW